MKRIKKIGVLQTAKVASLIYFLITAIFMIPIGIISSFFSGGTFLNLPIGKTFFFFMPFVYGIMVFIITAIGCVVYNLIAKWTGGIEIKIETID